MRAAQENEKPDTKAAQGVRDSDRRENGNATSNLVTIVHDDESVRESVNSLIRSTALHAKAFSSVEEFLASGWVAERPFKDRPPPAGYELSRLAARVGVIRPADSDDAIQSALGNG